MMLIMNCGAEMDAVVVPEWIFGTGDKHGYLFTISSEYEVGWV
jgi:hypothetical protein